MKHPTTLLATIRSHHLYLECACGRGAEVSVADAIGRLGHGANVGDVVDKARCAACGAKSVKEVRIVYKGASDTAMAGAAGKVDDDLEDGEGMVDR
jgi:hypothetical protein